MERLRTMGRRVEPESDGLLPRSKSEMEERILSLFWPLSGSRRPDNCRGESREEISYDEKKKGEDDEWNYVVCWQTFLSPEKVLLSMAIFFAAEQRTVKTGGI